MPTEIAAGDPHKIDQHRIRHEPSPQNPCQLVGRTFTLHEQQWASGTRKGRESWNSHRKTRLHRLTLMRATRTAHSASMIYRLREFCQFRHINWLCFDELL